MAGWIIGPSAPTPHRLPGKRGRIEWLAWVVLASLAGGATVVTQLASKRDASAARSGDQPGIVRYDSGWPFTYAHVRHDGLTGAAWVHTLTSPPPITSIAWIPLIIDCIVMFFIASASIGLMVGIWRVALRESYDLSPRHWRRTISIILLTVISWAAISVGIITVINTNQATDATTRAIIIQPARIILLAPGIIDYGIQQWFESDTGPNISLSGGIASIAEGSTRIALAVVLPAGLLALLLVTFDGWWRRIRDRNTSREKTKESADARDHTAPSTP